MTRNEIHAADYIPDVKNRGGPQSLQDQYDYAYKWMREAINYRRGEYPFTRGVLISTSAQAILGAIEDTGTPREATLRGWLDAVSDMCVEVSQ